MTGNSSMRKKLRAAFLAFVMVMSVFGGTIAFSGSAAADVDLGGGDDGTIDWAYNGTAHANVSVSQAEQPIEQITVGDNDAGNLGGQTVLTFPSGVTISDSISTSDLIISTNQSGGLDVTQSTISSDRRKLTIEHSGTSNENETLRIRGLNVTVGSDVTATRNGTLKDVRISYATGTATDTNLLNVHKPGLSSQGASSAGVGAATTETVVFNNTLNLTTTNASGQLASGDTIRLSLNDTSEVTFNTNIDPASTALVNSSLSRGVDLGTPSVSATEIAIPVNNQSAATTNVTFTNISVNATGQASDVNFTATIEEADGDTFAAEQEGNLGFINIQRPTVSTGNLNTEFSIGRQGAQLASATPGISVTMTADGQVADGTNVTVRLNNSDVTFDTSSSISANVNNAGSPSDSDTAGTPYVTSNMVTVEINGDLEGGDVVELDTGSASLAVNSSADMSAADVQLNVTTKPGTDRDDVLTTGGDLSFQRPTVSVNDGNNFSLYLGDTGNQSEAITGTSDLQFSEASNGSALNGNVDNNVTFTLESDTGVTFDQSMTTPTATDVTKSVTSSAAVTVVDDKTINVTLASADVDDGTQEAFDLQGVFVNGTADASNTTVSATVNTTGVSQTAGQIIVAEANRTTTQFNSGNNFTIDLDDNARGSDYAVTATTAKTLKTNFGSDDDIPTHFNVTYTLPASSGVTFDQSHTALSPSQSGISSASVSGAVVDERTLNLTVDISTPSQKDAGDLVSLGSVRFNATEDAQNTTIQFSLNNTSSVISNKDVAGQVQFNELTADTIRGDADVDNSDDPASQDEQVSVEVGNEKQVAVDVTNASTGGAFSGATVMLSSNDTAVGGTNVSSVTTYENGLAVFNVTTTDTANAQFNVTATLSSNQNISTNITVDVTSGSADQITASPQQNAVVDDGESTAFNDGAERAAIAVQLKDAQGNLIKTSTTVTIGSAGLNTSGSLLGLAEDKGSISSTTSGVSGQSVTPDDGEFYVVFGAQSGTKDVSVSLNTNNYGSASGTATIYSETSNIEVGLENKSQPLVAGQTANVSYTAYDGDGNVVEVSGLSVSPSSTNSTVIAPQSAGSVSTNANGVAYKNFSIKQQGTANLQGIESRTSLLGELAVEVDQPTLSVATNVSTVTVGAETDVQATVTYASNGTAVNGATVNVTGAGVSVADQTTNADGNATFTVNASQAGDITVQTTLTGTNSDSTTVTAQAPVDYNASVTFNDTTVQNGTETVTVDSASYTADGSAADYVVVVHVVNDDGSVSSPVGYSANLSGSAEDISVDLNASGAQGDALDSISENTTLRAMLHETSADSAYGAAISVDGSTVTDDANITVQDGVEVIDGTVAEDTNGDGLLDDLNGNDEIDRGDAQALFDALNSDAVTNNVGLFDYNGNGEVDRGDVQALFADSQA